MISCHPKPDFDLKHSHAHDKDDGCNDLVIILTISRYGLGGLEFNRGIGKLQPLVPKRWHLPSSGRKNQQPMCTRFLETSLSCQQVNSSSACACAPGYTGRACALPSTSCAQTPCLHGANCTEASPASGAGYTCNCDGTGHSGDHCQMELNHCAGSPCGPGLCLPQPGGFLCECGPDHAGSTCAKKRDAGTKEPRDLGQVRLLILQLEKIYLTQINAQEQSMSGNEDPCLSSTTNPCKAGGVCVFTVDGVTCECQPGFSGTFCEQATDPCAAVACPTATQCLVDTSGVASCACLPGYTGSAATACTKIDWCASAQCINGNCTDRGADFICTCTPGWQGATCAEDVAECATIPCLNGGSCTELPGSFSCTCPAGWTGLTCNQDIDECASNPCRYGVCSNTPGSYQCSCDPGWSGKNCDVNIDECLANGGAGQTCKNNGTCIDGINTFTCDCQPGFTGTLCEVNVDECAPRPCQNGATCVDGINSFSCNCTPRFMGLTCNLPYDPCASAPCLNGASCRKEQEERGAGKEYSCSCVSGFQGINCEVS